MTGTYAFLDDGRMYGLDFYVSALAGEPWGTLPSSNSLQSLNSIGWADFIDDQQQVGREVSGGFGRSFSGNGVSITIAGSPGNFQATATAQATWAPGDSRTLYGDPVALADAAGTYTGSVRTAGIQKPEAVVTAFTIDASGNITASATGCSFAGTMVQHGATGVFDLTLAASGSGCTLETTLSGVVVPLAVTNGKPEFALELNTADGAETAVFIVTKQ